MTEGWSAIPGAATHRSISRLVQRFRTPLVLADQGLVSGVNFLSTILLARFLGIEDFGRFTLAWTVVLFANSLQHGAIIQPMLSIGPKLTEAEAPAYYGAVIVQQVVAAAIAFAAVFIGVEASAVILPDWEIGGLAVPLAVALLAGQAQDFLRRYLFVRGRTVSAAVNDGIRYLGQLVLLYVVANVFSAGLTVPTALWIFAAAAILATVHGVLRLEKLTWSTEVLRQTIRRHWHVAKWLLPSQLMHWTTAQAFIIMAGAVLGAATVGMLRAAQAIVGVVHILYLGMENFATIHAAQAFHRQGSGALHHYLKSLTWKAGSAVLLLLVLINVNATSITRLMFGADYPELGPLLLAFSIIYFVALLNIILGVWALAIESTKVVFVSLATMTAVTVVAAYPLVVFGGVAGALTGSFLVAFIRAGILFTALSRKASAAAR
jgi:O-antigen/teichoic acid export membrane protein